MFISLVDCVTGEGSSITQRFPPGSVVTFSTDSELTGTHILSDRHITVLSSVSSTAYEEMPPASTLSNDFYVVSDQSHRSFGCKIEKCVYAMHCPLCQLPSKYPSKIRITHTNIIELLQNHEILWLVYFLYGLVSSAIWPLC